MANKDAQTLKELGIETFRGRILQYDILFGWLIPEPAENANVHVVYTCCSPKDKFSKAKGYALLVERFNNPKDKHKFVIDIHPGPLQNKDRKYIRWAIMQKFFVEAVLDRGGIAYPAKLARELRKRID